MKQASRGLTVAVLLLASFLHTTLAREGTSTISVDVNAGTVTGVLSTDGQVAAWLGVPFAAPPVGERRWRPPEPARPEGNLDATKFAAACMQTDYMLDWYNDLIERFEGDPAEFPRPEFSEDCLYLNIWAPVDTAGKTLPVMVWVHGGSHRGGWSYEPNYFGEQLARQGVIVVSIAYRLDVFGFFSHPDLPISNFGLLDQVAALSWIRDNIRNFGGDPVNVTVCGESAGAASIGYLLASPVARGLFQRVIHQSAGYEAVTDDNRADFLAAGQAVETAVLGKTGREGIDALREASPGDLFAAADEIFADYRPDVVVDGTTVREPFAESLAKGRLANVDLMIGTNADEWLMYLDPEAIDEELAAQVAAMSAVSPEAAAAVRDVGLRDSAARQLDRLITAEQFVCPSLDIASAISAAGGRSFVYYFDRVRGGQAARDLGAYHGAELPYVFDTHDDWLPTGDADSRLTDVIMQYWVSFAREGRPGSRGLPVWPLFESPESRVLVLGDNVRDAVHPEQALCAALNEDRTELSP